MVTIFTKCYQEIPCQRLILLIQLLQRNMVRNF
nr:MAG TPA: hypothetical protein [Caudoviricetes sp.]